MVSTGICQEFASVDSVLYHLIKVMKVVEIINLFKLLIWLTFRAKFVVFFDK